MANQNFKVKKGLEVGTALTATSDGLNVTGIITATQFNGDGSGLTGVTAAGSGVVVQEEGSSVGTAATINFIGSNVTAAISGGVASVTITGGSSDVVSDTTPQLGGNLDLNSKDITGTGNISVTGGINATGVSTFQNSVTFQSHASFGDSDKINFGNDQDLQIIHNGTSSFITNTAGGLYIRNETSNSLLSLQADNGSGSLGDYVVCNSTDQSVNIKSAGSNRFAVNTTGCLFSSDVTFTGDNYNVTWDKSADSLKFVDNAKIVVGTGDDLQIYHDGSNSYIQDAGEGALRIQGSQVQIKGSNTNNAAIFKTSAEVELYYDNSLKLETKSDGVDITGELQCDSLDVDGVVNIDGSKVVYDSSNGLKLADSTQLRLGTGNDLRLYHDSNNSYIQDAGTGNLLIQGSLVAIQNTSGETIAKFEADGASTLNFDGSGKLVTTNHGVTITGVATATSFSGSGSSLTGLTGASAGTYGASNNTPIITVDSNGRITGISTVATAGAGGGGGISNIVEDTTPQLGGNLDLNSKDITGSGDLDYTGNLKVTGISTITGVAGFSSHITLPDHAEIQVGSATGGDLRIYHNASDSYVRDSGQGGLYLTGSIVGIKNAAANETGLLFTENGAVQLYYDNSLKLATTSDGATITGELGFASGGTYQLKLSDNQKIRFGGGNDLQIYHDGTNSAIQNTTGYLYLYGGTNNIYLRAKNDEDGIVVKPNDSVELFYDNSKKFETTSSGATVTGTLSATGFSGSGASLTSLPSSQLTGALPAIDGSALTNLPASGITTSQSNTQVTYNIGASGNNYVITGPGYSNSDNNPDLYLVRGQRYRFINATGSSHPFRIQSDTSGTAYTDGVSGSQSGTQEFNVQHDAPSRLFYQCTIHSGMIGNIYITGGGQWENTSVAASGTPKVYTDYNVGIGTDNPLQKLHLFDTTSANIYLQTHNADTGSTAGVYFRTSDSSTVDGFFKTAIVLEDDGTSWARGKLHILQNNTADTSNATLDDSVLMINNNGNIGIGTDTPNHKLTLFQPGTGTFDAINFITGNTNANGYQMGINSSGDVFHWNTTNSSINFATNNAERLRIFGDGSVRIGDSSIAVAAIGSGPTLAINGAAPEITLRDSATNNPYAVMRTNDFGSLTLEADQGNDAANSTIHFRVDNAERMRINSSFLLYGDSASDLSGTHSSMFCGSNHAFQREGDAGTYLTIGLGAANGTVDLEADARSGGYPDMRFITTNTERLRIASDGQATFDKGAVGGANQVIARFQAESSRRLDIVWHDSGSLMGFDTPSNHSYVFKTNGTQRLRITSDGKLGVNVTNPGCQLGGIHAVHDATQGTPSFTGAEVGIFQRNYNGAQDCAISIVSGTNASSTINFGDKDDVNPGIIEYMNGSNAMRFSTNAAEAMRITSGRDLLVGTTATNPGDGNTTSGFAISSTGKYFFSCSNDGGHMNRNNAGYVLHTRYGGAHRGGIYVFPQATQYNTSSDYRLKENVVDISGAITRIKELAPRRFNFIGDGTTVDGFIAHEAATVVPQAVTGTYNEVDGDGNPVYQAIDNSKFVPLLTAALQEAITKIETLEAKVAALEG